ncbi:MAG TPA: precorrin-6y C5,15-methyltransferase (decarboxylating) subunit CbiE, partial [Pirellulaceae bacterium]
TGGDPLFYGIARFLCERLGKDRFNVVPHVSSMQLAFARVKESWDEAYLANLDSIAWPRALDKIRSCEKAGLFTTDTATPQEIARQLLALEMDYFSVYVCENLGSPDERVTRGELRDIAGMSFSPLNIVILIRQPNVPERQVRSPRTRLLGNPDEWFQQSQPKRGLLTPREVRVIALALLDLTPRCVMWDVGAGSGSVAIEASRLAADGQVFAIEMDAADHSLIMANAETFGALHVRAVHGQAPEIFAQLPDADAIFVGGTGRSVAELASAAWKRLRPGGNLVVNVGSLGHVSEVHASLRALTPDVSVRMVQISEGVEQMDAIRLESRSPTFLIHGTRDTGKARP